VTEYNYIGSELEVFAHATRWKAYFRSFIAPYLQGDVLEVGAGMGANTALLWTGEQSSWVCLEPDARLAARIDVSQLPRPSGVEVQVGDLTSVPGERRFDAIVYIDVLEHIEDDRGELLRAESFLKPGGAVVVVSPAHQFLYTPFDQAIGHYRRYTKGSLRSVAPVRLIEERLFYVDSVGFFASLANRLFLKSAKPTHAQIGFWDKVLVPMSRLSDWVLGYRAGKSVIGIWRLPEAQQARR
jgi:2-polyprenyl-3-methyl-5-hydroxy-6-metoxy-1,4-benzoquinol methylase